MRGEGETRRERISGPVSSEKSLRRRGNTVTYDSPFLGPREAEQVDTSTEAENGSSAFPRRTHALTMFVP